MTDAQKAYAAYLDAWTDLANMPGASERSAAQQAEADQAGQRLHKAEMAHLAAVNPEPGPYDLGLTEDPEMTWAEFRAELEAEAS